eukprot:768520-Hanusia_phi.AAC.6
MALLSCEDLPCFLFLCLFLFCYSSLSSAASRTTSSPTYGRSGLAAFFDVLCTELHARAIVGHGCHAGVSVAPNICRSALLPRLRSAVGGPVQKQGDAASGARAGYSAAGHGMGAVVPADRRVRACDS